MALFLDGKEVLSSIVMHGTWMASGTVTLPAVTLGGAMTLNGQSFDAGSGSVLVSTTGTNVGFIITSTQDTTIGAVLIVKQISASPAVNDIVGSFSFQGRDLGGVTRTYTEFQSLIEDATSAAQSGKFRWVTYLAGAWNEAMTLSGAGALWTDLSVDTLTYKVSGTQVVGARVVDARCDDAINSGDATTDGVIDALRDAMITHGLIAAA